MPTKKTEDVLEVPALVHERVEFALVGMTPFIFNRLSEKSKRDLLLPSGRKTTAEKAANVKHNPRAEFRNSVYQTDDITAPTLLTFPATAFKKAIGTAALEIPGATKASIGRLVRVEGYHVSLYGTPELMMTGVRSADAARTPDIRTRAILPQWACKLSVKFMRPKITAQAMANLLSAAGELIGVGDFRQEKGAGDFGLFHLTKFDDPAYIAITKQGRKIQEKAMDAAKPYDAESADLVGWWDEEIGRRDIRIA